MLNGIWVAVIRADAYNKKIDAETKDLTRWVISLATPD